MEYIRKRVGKDLRVTWPLTINKGAILLIDCDLKLEIEGPNGTSVFPDFTVREDGKAVFFTMLGTEYTATGCYTFIMWLNYGKIGQSVVDKVGALTLVRHSCEEFVPSECKLSIDSIEIESSAVEVGYPGPPGKDVENAVLFTKQSLSDEQRLVARDNIDVYSRNEVVTEVSAKVDIAIGNINALLNSI